MGHAEVDGASHPEQPRAHFQSTHFAASFTKFQKTCKRTKNTTKKTVLVLAPVESEPEKHSHTFSHILCSACRLNTSWRKLPWPSTCLFFSNSSPFHVFLPSLASISLFLFVFLRSAFLFTRVSFYFFFGCLRFTRVSLRFFLSTRDTNWLRNSETRSRASRRCGSWETRTFRKKHVIYVSKHKTIAIPKAN